MQRRAVALVAGLLLAATPAAAQDELRDAAESSVVLRAGAEGFLEVETVNRSFEWVGLYRPERGGYQNLLLRRSEASTRSAALEGVSASALTLEVFEVAEDGLLPLYTIADRGERGRVESIAWSRTYFVSTRFGCCGALDAERVYSLTNGRFLFSETGAPAWFEVPNAGGLIRIAAVHSAFSVGEDTLFGGRQDVLALVSFAAPTEPLQRFFVVASGPIDELDYGGAEVGWSLEGQSPSGTLTVWDHDGQRDLAQVQGLSLALSFSPRLSLRVPLVAGRLALDGADLPEGLSLEPVPLE